MADSVDTDKLDAPLENATENATETATGNASEIVSAVDGELVTQLIDMGFSQLVAEKALYLTIEKKTLDAALEWIEANQQDPEFESPIQQVTTPKPEITPEEAERLAYELQKRLRDERKQKEKAEEIEREKARLKQTKEILEQNAKYEEEQRKRNLQLLEKEKEDHKKERERQRELMRQEYRERFGKDPDEAAEQSMANKTRPKDRVAASINKLYRLHNSSNRSGLHTCFNTLKVYINNARENPTEKKYLQIRKENAAFKSRVCALEGATDVLDACGFKDEGEFLAIQGIPDTFLLSEAIKFIDLLLRQ